MNTDSRNLPSVPAPPNPPILGPATVEKWIYGGEGLVRYEGKVYFLTGAIPGDEVTFTVTEEKRSFGRGLIHDLLRPSSWRRDPGCPHFGRCGGCQWLHANITLQRQAKRQVVVEAFRQMPQAPDPEPILAGRDALEYRLRAVFHGAEISGGWKLGFFQGESHWIIPLAECRLLHPKLYQAFEAYEEQLSRQFCPRELHAAVGQVQIRGPWAVDFYLPGPRGEERFWRWQGGIFRRMRAGEADLTLPFRGMDVFFRVDAFFQNNAGVLEIIGAEVQQWLEALRPETVLDLYGGIGVFGLLAARAGAAVLGADANERAVACAKQNGRVQKYSPEQWQYLPIAVEDLAKNPLPWKPAAVITNPPREGMSREGVENLAGWGPREILYISCNPATLARDAARLVERGYHLRRLVPVDLFPQTYHVETLAWFGPPLSQGEGESVTGGTPAPPSSRTPSGGDAGATKTTSPVRRHRR